MIMKINTKLDLLFIHFCQFFNFFYIIHCSEYLLHLSSQHDLPWLPFAKPKLYSKRSEEIDLTRTAKDKLPIIIKSARQLFIICRFVRPIGRKGGLRLENYINHIMVDIVVVSLQSLDLST
jgi:hypothetical protein